MSQPTPNGPGANDVHRGNVTPQSSRERLSLTGLILGGVLLALAVLTLLVLAGLFVLGGGGDAERFSSVARGYFTVSITLGVAGLAALVLGLVTRK